MYALSLLVPMLERELVESSYSSQFLEEKLADASAVIFFYIGGYNLEYLSEWVITPEPSYLVKRLIVLEAALDIVRMELLRVKKTEERFESYGYSYSYSSSSSALKSAWEDLKRKRDDILASLLGSTQITFAQYTSLKERLASLE